MKVKLYTIYDNVAEEAGPLFEAKNDLVASRNAASVLQKVPVHLRKDYQLFAIGEVDMSNFFLQGEIYNEFAEISLEKAYWEEIEAMKEEVND